MNTVAAVLFLLSLAQDEHKGGIAVFDSGVSWRELRTSRAWSEMESGHLGKRGATPSFSAVFQTHSGLSMLAAQYPSLLRGGVRVAGRTGWVDRIG